MRELFGFWAFAYRRYFDFRGYSTREEFWSYAFIHVLLGAGEGVILFLLSISSIASTPAIELIDDEPAMPWTALIALVIGGLWLLFQIVSFIPGLAVTVRRYRDAGFSGRVFLMMVLIGLLMLVPSFALLYDTMFLLDLDSPNVVPGLLGFLGFHVLQLVNLSILALPSERQYR